jgi:very-short-patch-repair endonuclease
LPAGRLHRLHTGVYAVGHPVLGRRGRWMAAVLACGPGAALSHASAAALWELRASASTWIDVTVPRTGKRTRERIRVHRPRTLGPDEVTTRDEIPVTTPGRTIVDMAATLQESRLEHLLDQAEIRELTDYPALEALARAHPGHCGAGRLRAALRRHDAGTNVARSDLEILFKELCRARGLPAPRVNHRVEGKEVDFLFEAQKLVVETDSWRYHKTRHAFENDRARDAKLARAGYRTLRFTDTQIADRAAAVADTIAVALVQGSPGERAA